MTVDDVMRWKFNASMNLLKKKDSDFLNTTGGVIFCNSFLLFSMISYKLQR